MAPLPILVLVQLQAKRGYRANTDSLVLAFATWSQLQAHGADSEVPQILDLGAGNGLVSLLLGLRFERKASLRLVEMQPTLADRARVNLLLNGLNRGEVAQHDLGAGLPTGLEGWADVVVCNPPFYLIEKRHPPANEEKRVAHFETTCALTGFLEAACQALRENETASMSMIHDIQQINRIMDACSVVGLAPVSVREVLHSVGKPTGRVLVWARRKTALSDTERRTRGIPWKDALVLHPGESHQFYREEMEDFLRALPRPLFNIGRAQYLGSDRES